MMNIIRNLNLGNDKTKVLENFDKIKNAKFTKT